MLEFEDNVYELDPFDFNNSIFNPLDESNLEIYKPVHNIENDLQLQVNHNENWSQEKIEQSEDQISKNSCVKSEEECNYFGEEANSQMRLVGNLGVETSFKGKKSQRHKESGNEDDAKGQSKLRKKRKINEFKVEDSDQVIKLRQELNNILHSKKYSDEYKKKCCAKLRNRITAQQSRDRQKALIYQLEVQNNLLLKENEQLRSQIIVLQKENKSLKESTSKQQRAGVNPKGLVTSALLTVLTIVCCLQFITTSIDINQFSLRQLSSLYQQEQIQNFSSNSTNIKSNKFLLQKEVETKGLSEELFLPEVKNESHYDNQQTHLAMYCGNPQIFYQSSLNDQLDYINLLIPNKVFRQDTDGIMELELKVLKINNFYQKSRDGIEQYVVSNS